MYHYTGCGLPYVWLIDGYKERDAPHGVAIQYLDGLHCAIGREITFTGRPLSGDEVRFLRAELEWSQGKFADALGVKEVTVRKWEAGGCRYGPAVRLICALYREHAGGDSNIRRFVDRLTRLDPAASPDRLCFCLTKWGWEKTRTPA